MKNMILKVIVLIETLVLILCILYVFLAIIRSGKTELLRETSPNGEYILTITEIGLPDWPFGKDHLAINFFDKDDFATYRISFSSDVANDGCKAGYEVEWLEEGVLIMLKGSEQPTAYFILPYKEFVEEE